MLVGKALSGGYMPVAAMVTTREIYDKAVGTLERCYVHQSTYRAQPPVDGRGAGHAARDRTRWARRARRRIGAFLRDGPRGVAQRYEMIKEVRGIGLMIGIELGPPSARAAQLNWHLIHMASEGLFPQLIVIPLHRDHGMITMAAGKNDVIKLLPPLTLSRERGRSFLDALDAVLPMPAAPRARTGRWYATSRRTMRRRALRR